MRSLVSIVVPALNEEKNLESLVRRVFAALSAHSMEGELLVVLDGCTDGSLELLLQLRNEFPALTIVDLCARWGQHQAIAAGMRLARGDVVLTLDADLQNPPEALPELVNRLRGGTQAVGTWRDGRQDPGWRTLASAVMLRPLFRLAFRHAGRDMGCMLRGWRREVIDRWLAKNEGGLYVPAQLNRFAKSYVEIPVTHDPRVHGPSRYGLAGLVRLYGQVLRVLAGESPPVPEVRSLYRSTD